MADEQKPIGPGEAGKYYVKQGPGQDAFESIMKKRDEADKRDAEQKRATRKARQRAQRNAAKRRGGAVGMVQRAATNQAGNQQVALPHTQAALQAMQNPQLPSIHVHTPPTPRAPEIIHIGGPKPPTQAEKTAQGLSFLGQGADTTPQVQTTDDRGLPTSSGVFLFGIALVGVNILSQSNLTTLWQRIWHKPMTSDDVYNQTKFQKSSLVVMGGEIVFVIVLSVLSGISDAFMHFSMMLIAALWLLWLTFNFPKFFSQNLSKLFQGGSNNLFGPAGFK